MKSIVGAFFLISWVFGFVIAKGFWSTLFCVVPFYAWYLVVDRINSIYGLL